MQVGKLGGYLCYFPESPQAASFDCFLDNHLLKWENIGGINYGYLYFISKDDYRSADFFVPRMIEIKPLQKRPREKQRYFPSVDFAHGRMAETNDMAIACFLKIVPKDNVAIFCGRKDSANKMLSRIIELDQRGYDVSGLKQRCDHNEIVRISNLIARHYAENSVLCKEYLRRSRSVLPKIR